ncbi:hypothetical protein ACFPRL_32035 [Pseudoclavibacter helvolus]
MPAGSVIDSSHRHGREGSDASRGGTRSRLIPRACASLTAACRCAW